MALRRRSISVPCAAKGMSVIELVVAVALFSAVLGVFGVQVYYTMNI